MVQRHEYSIELNAPPEQVWEVFWYRAPDRPQPKDVKTRIEILHPGDDIGNGLVRHCYFPVPKWLLSGGVGQSWEWLTEVKPFESWRYDAVGKPLWSRATGWTRLDRPRRRAHARSRSSRSTKRSTRSCGRSSKSRCTSRLSRDNDTILAALEGGLRWHLKRKARAARSRKRRARPSIDHRLFVYGTLAPGHEAWPVLEPWVVGAPASPTRSPGCLYDTGRGYPAATFRPDESSEESCDGAADGDWCTGRW